METAEPEQDAKHRMDIDVDPMLRDDDHDDPDPITASTRTAPTTRRARRRRSCASSRDDDGYLDWNDAVVQDKVLRTQTLGGQYPDADEVQYMVGVFQGKDLHLTPVSSLVLLRPQLHHLDATTQQERSAASAASKETAAGTATAARAIHMTIKTTGDGDAVTTETMADRLRFVQSEPWRKLRYTDENEEAAWEVYNESLFLKPEPAPEPAGENKNGEDDMAARDLEEQVPKYGSKWGDKQLLQAVSGIIKAEPEPEPIKPEPKDKRQEQGTRGSGARAAGRPKSGGAAAPRKGARAKTTTIDID
ncbi:hypothetical protein HIM_00676 [Hirsutella minnesotensis 3608]|nr:hypothetical protein HIM_00676 [Hirsutella minnesotensis 3608]